MTGQIDPPPLQVSPLPSSFRDPSGFVYIKRGAIFRQVNRIYKEHYDSLMSSGLYDLLTEKGLLVVHTEEEDHGVTSSQIYKLLRSESLELISYPYEWSFSQLKDAALATLEIQQLALAHDMILKDASAYNIQFIGSRPVLIDTLSFERYQDGRPWQAYRQFCQHFLAPLALMSHRDVRLNQLLRIHVDGVPLDLASKLIPLSAKMKPGIFLHIHLHAKSQKRFHDPDRAAKQLSKPRSVRKHSLMGLTDHLRKTIKKMKWEPKGTEWAAYYESTNYSDRALDSKKELIRNYVDSLPDSPNVIWDLGANTGMFSRCVAGGNRRIVSADVDPAAVELNYLESRQRQETNLLPLLIDLTNPSPAIGWANQERPDVFSRIQADLILALALIHHLSISNHVPLEKVVQFFSRKCKWLIVEFVPKSDSQVRRLLSTREDIFDQYTEEHFARVLSQWFSIERTDSIEGSKRTLYLCRSWEE